jgi:sugar phosphate isomerase/epimerase
MNYSFMTFSTPQLTLPEVLATAEMYGYNGVEFRLDAKHLHGVEVSATAAERKAMRDQIAASGIAPACLATSIRYADPADEAAMLEQTHERIDLAADIGAPVIRVFGGAIPKDMPRDRAIVQVATCLDAVAEHAAKRGVTVCMETHDDWCDPVQVAAVLSRVNHPAIACNWDIMHPVRTGLATIESSFEVLQGWIRHVHVHDGVQGADLKMVPIGTGSIDHAMALRCLKSIHYNGFLSGEWINWEPYELHLPRELATLRQLEHDLGHPVV